MLKYNYSVTFFMLMSGAVCFAMDSDSDFVPSGGKREYIKKILSSEEASSERHSKQGRVKDQEHVQQRSYYLIDPSNKEMRKQKNRVKIIICGMKKHLKENGITYESQLEQIAQVYHDYELDHENGFAMKCPACQATFRDHAEYEKVLDNFFSHWFLTRRHQEQLYDQVAALVGLSREQAQANYDEHGLPTALSVPLPTMQESDAQAEYLPVRENKWFIVDGDIQQNKQSGKFFVLEGDTRAVVAARYVARKREHLELASEVVLQEGARLQRENDEFQKQLAGQEKSKSRKLVCSEPACDHILETSKVTSKSVQELFECMALHQLTDHAIGAETVLHKNAEDLAKPSFDQAYAAALRKLTANGSSKRRQLQ